MAKQDQRGLQRRFCPLAGRALPVDGIPLAKTEIWMPGRLKFFDDDSGFGIARDDGQGDVFMHVKAQRDRAGQSDFGGGINFIDAIKTRQGFGLTG